jgi:hypothetical protein
MFSTICRITDNLLVAGGRARAGVARMRFQL